MSIEKRKWFIKFVAPLLIVIIYAFMWWKWGTVSTVYENVIYTYGHIGLFRGIADMLMGCLAYELTQYIKCKFDRENNKILTAFELLGYLLTIILAFSGYLISSLDFLCIILLFISVAISFSGKSSFNHIMQHSIFTILGKFSLNVYVSHITLSVVIGQLITADTPLQWKYIYLVIYVLSALILAQINKIIADRIRIRFVN